MSQHVTMREYCLILTAIAALSGIHACSNYLIENLQKLQQRAVKVILGKPYEIRSCEFLADLGWQ